ncbi:MAG: hypothetical protein JW891_09585, partial [Candidatus Lokiarchaeota archaeon]|nr:hypothetical protein [Candidatus Lokiarchaeota archaeon]
MSLQIENVSKQIKQLMENLTYNGLNLVSKENIRQLELFLQNTSQLGAYRLATSLRYLHVELNRFLTNSSAFNIERYVFFLNNCWLQSRAFLSETLLKDKRKIFKETLMKRPSKPQLLKELELRVAGIEKVLLEGSMFGFIFHILSLSGQSKGKIFQWSLLQPPQGSIQPELLLGQSFKNSRPKSLIGSIIYKKFQAQNVPNLEKEGIIFLMREPNTKILFTKKESNKNVSYDSDSIAILQDYSQSASEILQLIENNDNSTPFDVPKISLDYIYLKNVKISNFERENNKYSKNNTVVFKIEHKNHYNLHTRILDKIINQKLINKLELFYENQNLIEGMFGKLCMQRGQL